MSTLSDIQKEAINDWMDLEGFKADKLQAGDYTKDAKDFLIQFSLGKNSTIDTRAVKAHVTSYLNAKTKALVKEFVETKKNATKEEGSIKGTP